MREYKPHDVVLVDGNHEFVIIRILDGTLFWGYFKEDRDAHCTWIGRSRIMR